MRLMLLFLILSLVIPFQGSGQTIVTLSTPVTEELDLRQDGNLTNPYIVNLTLSYTYVLTLIYIMHFTDNIIEYDDFGGDPALTNGLNVFYGLNSIINNDNYTSNAQLANRALLFEILSDENNPQFNVLRALIDITNFSPSGLLINHFSLHFYVQDNLSALTTITDFRVIVEGYRVIQRQAADQPSPFDPLAMLDRFWRESGVNITIIALGAIFALLVWIGFKRIRGS